MARSFAERLDVFLAQIVLGNTAVHFQCTDGCDDDGNCRVEAGLAAFDVEKLLGPEIGAEARFGYDIVGEAEACGRRHDRVAAMSDIGEGAAVDESRIVLERLHQIWHQRVF